MSFHVSVFMSALFIHLFVQSSRLEIIDTIYGYLSCGIMQSSVCHLRGLDQRQMVAAKEEATEMGGLVSVLDWLTMV